LAITAGSAGAVLLVSSRWVKFIGLYEVHYTLLCHSETKQGNATIIWTIQIDITYNTSVVDKGDMGLTVPGFSSSDAAASGAELRTRGSSQSGEAPARGYNASRAPIGWR